jgi:hypothetical protein
LIAFLEFKGASHGAEIGNQIHPETILVINPTRFWPSSCFEYSSKCLENGNGSGVISKNFCWAESERCAALGKTNGEYTGIILFGEVPLVLIAPP